jgi:hypothetical protein
MTTRVEPPYWASSRSCRKPGAVATSSWPRAVTTVQPWRSAVSTCSRSTGASGGGVVGQRWRTLPEPPVPSRRRRVAGRSTARSRDRRPPGGRRRTRATSSSSSAARPRPGRPASVRASPGRPAPTSPTARRRTRASSTSNGCRRDPANRSRSPTTCPTRCAAGSSTPASTGCGRTRRGLVPGPRRRAPRVATGTASGKSLCYQLPVFDRLLADDKAVALYLAPTKALAHDQLRSLRGFRLPRSAPRRSTGTPRSRSARRSADRELGADQPRPAAPRAAAQPPVLARPAAPAHVRRRRRVPRRPRRVRRSRGARPATAAAARRALRRGSDLPADQRDDRQPGRARQHADRPRGGRDHP